MIKNKKHGFTLIEILVVLTIIGILAALLVPTLFQAKKGAKEKAVKLVIEEISKQLELYNSKHGDYPPTSLDQKSKVKIKLTNNYNNGNESMTLSLFSQNLGGPFLDYSKFEPSLTNIDNDFLQKNYLNTIFTKLDLYEISDTWGVPFVYFHWRDFENPKSKGYDYTQYKTSSAIFECVPQKDKKGVFHAFRKFQIWSFGIDQKNQNGDGDDITNWEK